MAKREGSGSVYTHEYREFLKLLVAARGRSGLTQRELAQQLGRSYSYVAKIETGDARMDILQIRQYLQAVGKDFLEFMSEYEAALQTPISPQVSAASRKTQHPPTR